MPTMTRQEMGSLGGHATAARQHPDERTARTRKAGQASGAARRAKAQRRQLAVAVTTISELAGELSDEQRAALLSSLSQGSNKAHAQTKKPPTTKRPKKVVRIDPMTPPRMTAPTQLILREFLSSSTEKYGLEICRAIGYPAGTVHPLLYKFEALGWLESRVEDIDPTVVGRPKRRYYRLTETGTELARDALAQVDAQKRAA